MKYHYSNINSAASLSKFHTLYQPEKFDSLSRNWRDHDILSRAQLFLVDECLAGFPPPRTREPATRIRNHAASRPTCDAFRPGFLTAPILDLTLLSTLNSHPSRSIQPDLAGRLFPSRNVVAPSQLPHPNRRTLASASPARSSNPIRTSTR